MIEPILSVLDLKLHLNSQDGNYEIIRGISFAMYPGKTLALVGESGSGKSLAALSLLKIQSTPPFSSPQGQVYYRSKALFSLSDKELRKIRGGKIAMIFQDPNHALNAVYTIGKQLMEVAMLHLEMNEEEAFKKGVEALKAVGIPDPEAKMETYPHELSGGMKQRVMIAMALMGEPEVLIADEPTTALDVTIQAQVLDLLKSIQEKTKMAILLITHDMGVVAELAHDVAVMYAGLIVETAKVDQIFMSPSHPYTKGLFKAFKKEGEKGFLHTIKGTVPSFHCLPSGCTFHTRCPYVFKPCYQGDVPFFKINEKHQAACWLYE